MKNKNDYINYIIVKLLNGSDFTIEIPETYLKQNYKNLIVGAFYYCEKYNCGCELIEIL